jgi:tetratricopeptide (TPR) repeat protein
LARSRISLVYRAFDQAKQREVAIKVLLGRWRKEADGRHRWVRFADDPRAMDCLVAEVDLWIEWDHPHLVRAFQVVHNPTTEHLPAIVMDYCAGGSLADWIYRGQPPLLPEGLDAAIQVCWAVQYLHDKQCTHLNLKSQNVLLARDDSGGLGRVLVSDPVLGWAFCAPGWQAADWPEDPEESELWETLLENKGTPTHMAPEFWGTFATTGPTTDAYAFGVLLYEVFCRRLPFAGAGSLRQLHRAHLEAAVPDPRQWNQEIPPALADLMQRCLAKDPSERPAGFGQLAGALAGLYREATGLDYDTVRQKPATPELEIEVLKRQAWRKVLCGVGAQRRGDFEVACRLIQEGEDMFRSLNDPAALQQSLNRHAVALHASGRLDEAMTLLKEQEALCHQLADRTALSSCLLVQGLVLKSQGQLEAALRVLEQDEAICRELNDQVNLSSCLFNQAGVLADQDRLEEATQRLAESERISRELGEHDPLQESLHYHALILKACGRPQEALQLLKEQEAICRELDDQDALSACLDSQASIRQELEQR